MDNMSYIIYTCFMIPMLLSLLILEKKSRLVVGYILVGATCCLFIAEINGALFEFLHRDMVYYCTTVSPILEEMIKMCPILYYSFLISDNKQKKASDYSLNAGNAGTPLY